MLSHFSFVWLCKPMDAARQASLSSTVSWSLLKLMSIELVMPFNRLILCCPLFFLPSIFLSIRIFSNELALHMRWPQYWSFSFSISPSNEYSGLIFLGIDWCDILAVQGTLRVFSDTTVRKRSAFFMVQLSHPNMTNGKTRALTRQTFVMPLLFNMLSRFVMTFLPRIKCILILWLQSLSAVILEPKKIKSVTVPAWQADSLPLSHWGSFVIK